MLLNDGLFDLIIALVAEKKDYTVQTLHKIISRKEKISLSHFYKIIDDLLKRQILAKEGGHLILHARWILSLFELSDTVKKHYYDTASALTIDLKEGEQKSFYAGSLVDLDNIWANLLNTLSVMHGKKEDIYFYNAHTYHILGMNETESSNFKQFGNNSHRVYFLTGNQTALDNYGLELLRMQGTDVFASDKVKFLKEGYCINIIGDYIIEVLFPETLTQYFKVFFDNTSKIEDFNSEMFHNIFRIKAECKLNLRRSASQSSAFKKEIKKYF